MNPRLTLCACVLGAAACYGQSSQPLSLTSPSLPVGTVGVAYPPEQYTGMGGFSPYFYSLATGTLPPGLTLNSSGALYGTPTTPGTFSYFVNVFDSSEGSALSPVQTITINPPGPNLIAPSLAPGTVGIPYPPATYSATGGGTPYTFSIASGSPPPGLALNTSGLLSGTPTSSGVFAFLVRVTDNRQNSALSQTQTITVNPQPLSIVTASLPNGMAGVPYPASPLAAVGGSPPYSWSVSAGALPPGLALSSSGIVSGSPFSPGVFSFTVTVMDSARLPQTASGLFQISIAQPITVSPSTVPPGTVGNPYKPVQFTASIASTAGSSFAIAGGAPPPGLTLTSAGVLSGTPTQAGTFTFIVVASGQGGSGSTVITMLVYPALSLLPVTIPDINPNVSTNIPIGQATGGNPPYSWTLSGCSIPGITLTSAGSLVGIASSPGSFTCTLTVTDASGASANGQVTIKVLPFLVITTTSLPSSVVGSPYPVTGLSATGGKPPYLWSLASGSLPPGLALSSSGGISGTPTGMGTFAVGIKVTDSAGASAIANFSITVTSGPAIAPVQFPDGAVNRVYPPVTVTVTGGTQPYAFAFTGTLPPGISLSSAGIVSGTPTQAGSFRFAIQVTDANNQTATASYTINIAAAPLTITTTSLPPAMVFIPYSQTVSASGGTAPYGFRVLSGALPAGLSLTSSGLLSGTPAASGTFSFIVQAADSGQPPQVATQPFTVVVALPAVPSGSLQNLPDKVDATQQQSFGFSLQSGYPTDIKGVLTLTFVSSAVVPSTDPALKFTNGDSKIGFTIPANKTDAVFDTMPLFSTGMVAGTITLTASLSAAGTDVTPSPVPSRTIVVNPAPPVINSVTATNASGQLTLTIQGFATTRQTTQAKFHFDAAGIDLTVDVGAAFTQWYQSPASVAFGSSFTYAQPFTVQGSLTGSVTVTLINDRGTSNTKSVTEP